MSRTGQCEADELFLLSVLSLKTARTQKTVPRKGGCSTQAAWCEVRGCCCDHPQGSASAIPGEQAWGSGAACWGSSPQDPS